MSLKHFSLIAAYGLVLLFAGGTQGKPPASNALLTTSRGRIIASFNGLRGHNGYLRVSLFNADSFPDGVPLARRDVSLQSLGMGSSSSLMVTFAGLRPGAYAVCAFHDRDSSGKITQNFLGIPQEEWGMSGNPHPQFRAPRFDEAKIGLSAREEKAIKITLHT